MGVKPSRSVSIGPVSNDLGVNEPVPSPLGGQSPGFEKRMHSLMGEVPFEGRRGGVEQDKVAERAVVGQGRHVADAGGPGGIAVVRRVRRERLGIQGMHELTADHGSDEGLVGGEPAVGPVLDLPAAPPEGGVVEPEMVETRRQAGPPQVRSLRVDRRRPRRRRRQGVAPGPGRAVRRPRRDGRESLLGSVLLAQLRLLRRDVLERLLVREGIGLPEADIAAGDGVEELSDVLEGVRVEALVGRDVAPGESAGR